MHFQSFQTDCVFTRVAIQLQVTEWSIFISGLSFLLTALYLFFVWVTPSCCVVWYSLFFLPVCGHLVSLVIDCNAWAMPMFTYQLIFCHPPDFQVFCTWEKLEQRCDHSVGVPHKKHKHWKLNLTNVAGGGSVVPLGPCCVLCGLTNILECFNLNQCKAIIFYCMWFTVILFIN